ncbi:hypothetical protein ACIPZ8_08500 [Pseudomonas sp. NPDC089422]|uniref:hypothetical protein n=1 Tax=Pseudomonas sp. NPDC089422 TaxID=3364466 RepID=UPI0037FFDE2D
MSSTQYFQIFFDCPDKHQVLPDASAGYELVLSENLEGWGAAQGVMHPIITIKQDAELCLPQTFSFMIDGKELKAGNRYHVSLRYKVTTDSNKGERVVWNETFVAQDSARIVPKAFRGHGPCLGRTGACINW